MVLFSTTYTACPKVSKPVRNGPNLPSPNANDIRLSDLPFSGPGSDFVFQAQRDEFCRLAPVEHRVRKKPLHQHANPAKGDPSHHPQAADNSAKHNHIEQKAG